MRRPRIRLVVLPPHSPQLNGWVERAHRTHPEEFYELYDGDLDLASANRALLGWEKTYNTIRPHRSLAKKTPAEYLQLHHPPPSRTPACLICPEPTQGLDSRVEAVLESVCAAQRDRGGTFVRRLVRGTPTCPTC